MDHGRCHSYILRYHYHHHHCHLLKILQSAHTHSTQPRRIILFFLITILLSLNQRITIIVKWEIIIIIVMAVICKLALYENCDKIAQLYEWMWIKARHKNCMASRFAAYVVYSSRILLLFNSCKIVYLFDVRSRIFCIVLACVCHQKRTHTQCIRWLWRNI